jgi:hypothetical protein
MMEMIEQDVEDGAGGAVEEVKVEGRTEELSGEGSWELVEDSSIENDEDAILPPLLLDGEL